jgi:hypothetical protein
MSGQGCSRQPLAACGTNWPRATSCRLRAARSGYAVKTVAASNCRAFGVGLCLTNWSSRRPQAALVGALRAAHSGAAYRKR